jgi:secreted trypsin-like serine protease
MTNPLAKRAVLLVTQRGAKTSSCTAVPLTEKVLMTAAHCVSDAQATNVTAVFTTDMNCDSGAEQKLRVTASRLMVHPAYDKTPQSKSDLALVKLSSNIPADYQTAGLYDGFSPLSNDEVVMLGYGITDEQKQDSMVLRTTTKSYKSDAFVKESLIGFNQTTKGGGYCRGDSGAPIYVTSGGAMKIIGINSFNVGKEKNRECHTASFGMYIPHFKSWVLAQTVEL